MTGKTLRASLLSSSMVLLAAGISMLNTPSMDGTHINHIIGALLMMVGGILAFIREQVKEDQAEKAVETLQKIGIIL